MFRLLIVIEIRLRLTTNLCDASWNSLHFDNNSARTSAGYLRALILKKCCSLRSAGRRMPLGHVSTAFYVYVSAALYVASGNMKGGLLADQVEITVCFSKNYVIID